MQVRGYFGEGQIIAPPQVDAPALTVTGFVACPVALQGGFRGEYSVETIYRLAYERALAALRPSWYARLYRVCQN
jgi:hypothetical protein